MSRGVKYLCSRLKLTFANDCRASFSRWSEAYSELQNTYAKPRGREGVNNTILKEFSGGALYLARAGSSNTQRGISTPIVICDESEAYESSDEGFPTDILWQRSATFGDNRKLIEMSTPTVKGKSRIENSYLQGDQTSVLGSLP